MHSRLHVVWLFGKMMFVFRWKGENVATTEVTEIFGLVDFIQEANVYGVEIPGTVCSQWHQNQIFAKVNVLSRGCFVYTLLG